MLSVLIVDDSPTVRMVLQNLLDRTAGIRVVGQARNGREAVEMANQLKPDLITMDVAMPEMDGLAATRRIMAVNPTPIIIVTGQTNSKELNVAFEAMRAGALDVIAKPKGYGLEPPDWENELLLKIRHLAGVSPRIPLEEKDSE